MTSRPPSLLTRVATAVVVAFGVVFFVVGAIIVYLTLDSATGQLPRQVRQVTEVLGTRLAQIDRRDEIARVGVLLDALQRENEPRGRLSWIVILDESGQIAFAPEGVPNLDWAQIPDGATKLALNSNHYTVFGQRAKPWRIVFIDDADARRADVMGQVAKYLAILIGIALLLVLVPVWIAVRSGLKPLRQLSEIVAIRRMDDLTPIFLPKTHRELEPLVKALNALMITLAQGIEREKSFVHHAAHELRTPLAVISTQAHLLAHADHATARDQAEQQLLSAVQRASHLVHQLLRLAQLDARPVCSPGSFDLMALVRDCVADFAVHSEYEKADLGVSGPDQLLLQGDRNAVQSIIENLLDNALRYGGPLVRVDIDIVTISSVVELVISDNGPGIGESQRSHVFERFYRGESFGQSGSGLGLAIVAEAVRSLGGEIHLRSNEDGRGCRFIISLPKTTS